MPQRESVTAVVLCGGGARRMGGGHKPLIRVAGETLLGRILDRLTPQVTEVLLACGAASGAYAGFDLRCVPDLRSGAGPLAGIESALVAMHTPWLLVCPGDAPELPVDLRRRLAQGGAGEVRVAHDGVRRQSLHLLVNRCRLPCLGAWLDAGHRSVGGWLDAVGARTVSVPGAGAFINLNTRDDVGAWACTGAPSS